MAVAEQASTAAQSSSSSSSSNSGGASPDKPPADSDQEPEVALILLACGIGLTTGASIVLFNYVIHDIRDLIWHKEALLSSAKALRNVSESELWPKVVFPPLLGGGIVGLLGWVMGGYNDKPAKKKKGPSGSSKAAAGSTSGNAGSGGSALASTGGSSSDNEAAALASREGTGVTNGEGSTGGFDLEGVRVSEAHKLFEWSWGGTFVYSSLRHCLSYSVCCKAVWK